MGHYTTVEFRVTGEPTLYMSSKGPYAKTIRGTISEIVEQFRGELDKAAGKYNYRPRPAEFVGKLFEAMMTGDSRGWWPCVSTHPERVTPCDDRVVLEFDGVLVTIWTEEYGEVIDKVTVKWGEL